MRTSHLTYRSMIFGYTVLIVAGISPTLLQAQPVVESVTQAVQSMTLATNGAIEITSSPVTGLTSFVATTGEYALSVKSDAKASAEERALAFVQAYGKAFGLHDVSQVRVIRVEGEDEVGMEHVRLQQVHQGVPVAGGELTVHLRGTTVVAVLAKTAPDLDTVDTTPGITPPQAIQTAKAMLAKHRHVTDAVLSNPRLEILNRGLLERRPDQSRLAWFLEATRTDLREFIWIDALTGNLLLSFSQLAHARNREVYDAHSLPFLPGTLIRIEGGPATGDTDANKAYDFAGDTYDYFFTVHGRDSIDNAGAPIISTVHYCDVPEPSPDCPLQNAFWNGVQLTYGDGFASADDVVAHEITHGITEFEANLFYYMQSGALNESFSDIFGETVDLTNGAGTDTPAKRWLIGEDVPPPIGAIRNMMNPNAFGDPGKVSDPQFVCASAFNDVGGVHSNSGVPNHAYALMVDGGTYNGITVTGIGLSKAAKVQYRALTRYLVSASDFLDNYNAVQRSCTDLVGGPSGITAANCTQVKKALDAVQMSRPACGQAAEPPVCPAGQTLTSIFKDNLERIRSGNWRTFNTGINHWNGCVGIPDVYCSGYATSGVWSFFGFDYAAPSDSSVAMSRSFPLPATGKAYLHFRHAFEFEPLFDGGVIEYSTNGGRTWLDAGTLIRAGARYNDTLDASNPLGSRRAFTKNSFGYTASRLDLSTLASRSVRFRFRIGTDDGGGILGWIIDDISLHTCK